MNTEQTNLLFPHLFDQHKIDAFLLDSQPAFLVHEVGAALGLQNTANNIRRSKLLQEEVDCKQLEYVAFDNLVENEFDKNLPKKERSTPHPLSHRLRRLEWLRGCQHVIIAPYKVIEFPRDLEAYQAHFSECTNALGWEGLILKKDILYTHKRTSDWLKHKPTHTFTITGFKEGQGRHAGRLGALHCTNPKLGISTWVGAGFDDDTRGFYWQNQQNLLGSAVEVEAASVSQNAQGEKSLRHPIFVRLHLSQGVFA